MTRTLALRDGRTLELGEYGDPGGHPIFFFHGLIGSHHQASYIDDQARRQGLRLLAPNRPGVGLSTYLRRNNALGVAHDVDDLARALAIDDFSLIGISGGTPYALATLLHHGPRVRTTTILSGMGPMNLPGALRGMDRRRRLFLRTGSRYPGLARRALQKAVDRFRVNPRALLDSLIATWPSADRRIFRRQEIYDLFLLDMDQVFSRDEAAEGLAQELSIYRNYGFDLRDLPRDRPVVLWHGLSDTIVPPSMAWALTSTLPNPEVHLLPGGHFMAIDAADSIIHRLRQHLDNPA